MALYNISNDGDSNGLKDLPVRGGLVNEWTVCLCDGVCLCSSICKGPCN